MCFDNRVRVKVLKKVKFYIKKKKCYLIFEWLTKGGVRAPSSWTLHWLDSNDSSGSSHEAPAF